MTDPLRIVFFGTPEYAVNSLKMIHGQGYEIPLVVTQPDRKSGRKMIATPTPVKQCAISLNIPVHQPQTPNDPETLQMISDIAPDVICVIAYGEMLGNKLLKIPTLYPLNAHGSILPRWRGASPIQAAIRAGDTETGVTIMKVIRKLDAGDIGVIKRIPISADETCGSLHDKLAVLSAEAFIDALALAQKRELNFTPQDPNLVTMTYKLKRDDGAIDFSLPAGDIERIVRAYKPWPGSTGKITINDNAVELKIISTRISEVPETHFDDQSTDIHPGKAIIADPKYGIWIQTGDGPIEIVDIQCPGKKACTAKEFMRGYR